MRRKKRLAWKQNAAAWRELYRQVTLEHGIPHDAATVRAESAFRRLAEKSRARRTGDTG